MVTLAQLRGPRIFGLAIFDLVSALIGMVIIFLVAKAYHFPHLDAGPFVWAAVLLTLPTGILFHVLFGVNTQLNYDLGLSKKP